MKPLLPLTADEAINGMELYIEGPASTKPSCC